MTNIRQLLVLNFFVVLCFSGCRRVFPYDEAPTATRQDGGLDALLPIDGHTIDGRGDAAETDGLLPFDGRIDIDGPPIDCADAKKFDGVGKGFVDDPYQICNATQLADLYNKMIEGNPLPYHFIQLQQDISMQGAPPLDSGAGFFHGSFDGNDHQITGLSQPLFHTLKGNAGDQTIIKNLVLSGVKIQEPGPSQPLGALTRTNEGVIEGVQVHGRVIGSGIVGGLVGTNEGKITRCITVGIVQGESDVGGLVGTNEGKITQSSSHAQVGSPLAPDWKIKGGLVGTNVGEITESFATGHVTGEDQIGGLVGQNASLGVIQSSYALGSVQGRISVGGLVGVNSGAVNRSYAGGQVLLAAGSTDPAGGLVGTHSGSGSYEVSVWKKTFNYPHTGLGNAEDDLFEVFGRHDAELYVAKTFTDLGWKPVHGWDLQDGQPPRLAYEGMVLTIDPEFRNGRKIGWSNQSAFALSGTCSGSGLVIITGDATTAGNLSCTGSTWTTSLDFSASAPGPVYIQVEFSSGSGTTVLGRTFILERPGECNTATLPGTFAGGAGEENDPFLICNGDQLLTLSQDSQYWDNHFKLLDNISLVGGAAFSPIGNDDFPFAGTFDGNGFSVSGLTILETDPDPDAIALGFFGEVSGATIQNLWLSAPSITLGVSKPGSLVGSLVGWARLGATLSNCHVIDSTVTTQGKVYLGGMVGNADGSTIDHCSFDGSVFSNNSTSNTGGLVGKLSNSSLKNSLVSGNSLTSRKVEGWHYTGGLVGFMSNSTIHSAAVSELIVKGKNNTGGLIGHVTSTGTVMDCAVSGQVIGEANTGGAVGSLFGPAEGCVSFAAVEGTRAVGGLAGSLEDSGAIERCYAVGSATADGANVTSGLIEAGGLVGVHNGVEITNSFALGPVLAQNQAADSSSIAGGLVGHNSGSISFSYAANETLVAGRSGVESDGHAGGLVGVNNNLIADCFAATDVRGGSDSENKCGPIVSNGEDGQDTYFLEGVSVSCGDVASLTQNKAKEAHELYSLPVTDSWDGSAFTWITVPFDQPSAPDDYPVLR